MLRSQNKSEKHFPIIAFSTVLIITLVLFLTISWQSLAVRTDMKTIQNRVLKMQELVGIINHLDEVLTMSARMGAETGNIQWEKRYLEFEPQLDNAIKEAENLAPNAFQAEAAAQTDTANIKLVAMERQSFELVRQGKKDDALAILFSAGYEEQKRSYATGMGQITALIQMEVKEHLKQSNQQVFFTVSAICITLPILIILWIYVLRLMKKYSTHKKMMDDIILESKEKALLLLNSTGEAIYGIDIEGNCTFCNPSCLRLLGYKNEKQLLGRHMHSLMHHTRKDGTRYPMDECRIYKAFKEGEATHVDDEIFWRADGTSFETEYRSFPTFRDKNFVGAAVGSVVSFVDISERKQIEREVKALNESLEQRVIERTADVVKLSQALKYSTAVVIITDTEGEIEYVNPMFTQLTGYSIEEAIGKNPSILKSDKMPPEVYEELWSTIISGIEWNGELCNKKKSGEQFWEHASISPVKNDKGVITNFIAVKDDITERKKMEDALKELETKYRSLVESTNTLPWEYDDGI